MGVGVGWWWGLGVCGWGEVGGCAVVLETICVARFMVKKILNGLRPWAYFFLIKGSIKKEGTRGGRDGTAPQRPIPFCVVPSCEMVVLGNIEAFRERNGGRTPQHAHQKGRSAIFSSHNSSIASRLQVVEAQIKGTNTYHLWSLSGAITCDCLVGAYNFI